MPPLNPSKGKGKRNERLPYTTIFNAALGIGLTRSDIIQMPWGELILMLQARADEYESLEDTGTREATWSEISAWI